MVRGPTDVISSLGDQAPWVPQTSLMCSLAMTSMNVSLLLKSEEDERSHCSDSTGLASYISDKHEETGSEEGALVDIDPLEGKRRGEQLMSMLSIGEDLPTPSRAGKRPDPAPRHRLLASAPPFHHTLAASAPPFQPFENPPPWQGSFSGFGSTGIRRYAPVIKTAAAAAFGADLHEIESDSGDNFIVRLRGKWANEDPWTTLNTLNDALWQFLGKDALSVQPNIMPRRNWLSLHCLDTASLPADQCWNFARHGCCPRGHICRWAHNAARTYTFDVEVVLG